MIGVYIKRMKVDLDDSGGEVLVEYVIDLDLYMMFENDFLFKIKEVGVKN